VEFVFSSGISKSTSSALHSCRNSRHRERRRKFDFRGYHLPNGEILPSSWGFAAHYFLLAIMCRLKKRHSRSRMPPSVSPSEHPVSPVNPVSLLPNFLLSLGLLRKRKFSPPQAGTKWSNSHVPAIWMRHLISPSHPSPVACSFTRPQNFHLHAPFPSHILCHGIPVSRQSRSEKKMTYFFSRRLIFELFFALSSAFSLVGFVKDKACRGSPNPV
jgi:hypothetical protein